MIPCKTLVVSTDYLGIKIGFFRDYADTISDRIHKAAVTLGGTQTAGKPSPLSQESLFAVNQCVHLASSIVLLGTEESRLNTTTAALGRHSPTNPADVAALRGVDPTTVLTMATLYYLLWDWPEDPESKLKRDDEELRLIRLRLDNVNWLIGRAWMAELEIATTT